MTPIHILLQTTIGPTADDWNIGRFSLLRAHLEAQLGEGGAPAFTVTARDRAAPPGVSDPVLATLAESAFDELWLFAVDTGDGLNDEERSAIEKFRERGGGVLIARDHMDLGCSICDIAQIGRAHHFHSHNQDPDPARRAIDDPYTTAILWPNYHSGANGDYQEIATCADAHPLLADPEATGSALRYLPAHPHEGDVSAPSDDASARVIATGTSKVTGAEFAIAVAFERDPGGVGPAVAQSTFHHFADYNWDPAMGSPSFVSEAPGRTLLDNAEANRSARQYTTNLAYWLAEEALDRRLDQALDMSFPASDPIAFD